MKTKKFTKQLRLRPSRYGFRIASILFSLVLCSGELWAQPNCTSLTTYTVSPAQTVANNTIGVNGGTLNLVYTRTSGTVIPGLGNSFTIPVAYSDFNNTANGTDNRWAGISTNGSYVVLIPNTNGTNVGSIYRNLPPNNQGTEPATNPNSTDRFFTTRVLSTFHLSVLGNFTMDFGNYPALPAEANISASQFQVQQNGNLAYGSSVNYAGWWMKPVLQTDIFNGPTANTNPFDITLGNTYTYRYAAFSDGIDYPTNSGNRGAGMTGSVTFCFDPVVVSGRVFNDLNANTIVDGSEIGTNLNTNLYVYLVSTSGQIMTYAQVTANGTYSMQAFPNTDYTLRLSQTQYATGTSPAINLAPPNGWENSGENGAGNTGGDGTPDGILAVSVGTTDLSQHNFGLRNNLPPFVCNTNIYQVAGPINNNSTLYRYDINSGVRTTVAPLTYDVNAIGYNSLDNTIWGYNRTDKGLVQIGANGTSSKYVIPNLPDVHFNCGAILNGGYLLLSISSSSTYYVVDVNPTRSTFLKLVDPLQSFALDVAPYGTTMSSIAPASDWAYNATTGMLYSIGNPGTSNEFKLITFNPLTGSVTYSASSIAGAGIQTEPYGYGSVFTDMNSNYMYVFANDLGRYYRVNLATSQATLLSQSITSRNNDGANCTSVSLTVDISGNVFNDLNGNTLIDGGETGSNLSTNLYVYLVDSFNVIVDSAHVAPDGTYSLNATPNSNYTLHLSNVEYFINSTSTINTNLPNGWENSGENGAGNTGSGDGTPDGVLAVSVGTTDVTQQNFGLISECSPYAPGAVDTDGDGISDICDLDDDNDGIPDCVEDGLNSISSAFALRSNASIVANPPSGPTNQIQLTRLAEAQQGQAWSNGKIDFTKNFTISMEAFMSSGSTDADGIAIVFQNSPDGQNAVGQAGQGLGARGIANGIALELDIFQNTCANDQANGQNCDPSYDHGTIRTTAGWIGDGKLTGDVQLGNGDIADNQWHTVVTTWDVATQTLSYTFNGTPVSSHTFPVFGANSIESILGGTTAYFGYTASTGFHYSQHKIGFNDLCSLPLVKDTDGDGIPDHLDLDSDGDGCPDAIEGGANFTYSNLNPDGSLSGSVSAGIPVQAGSGQSVGYSKMPGLNACIDTDGDGIPDIDDLDDDNDGILDWVECPPVFASYTNSNITGANAVTATVSNIQFPGTTTTATLTRVHNGTNTAVGMSITNRDLSNTFAFHPPASSSEPTIDEAIQAYVGTNNYTLYTVTLNEPVSRLLLYVRDFDFMRTRFTGNHRERLISGGTEFVYNAASRELYDIAPVSGSVSLPARDGFGIVEITSADGAPFTQVIWMKFHDPNTTLTPDGNGFTFALDPICDTDGDGIPDIVDLDSDSDGCPDAIEGSGSFGFGNLNLDGSLSGPVSSTGIPTQAGSGQSNGTSKDSIQVSNECMIPITGTVFNDVNANTIIDGSESGTTADTDLYIYLVDGSGKIVDSAKVASNGTYTVNAAANTNYTLHLSTVQYTIGTSPTISTAVPDGWDRTGENGNNNTGNGDGTPDGILSVAVGNSDVDNQNFGLKISNPLPINLLFFEARKDRLNAVLNWSTIKEENNLGFAVENSKDGQVWKSIGFVPSLVGNGNSSSRLDYTFNHIKPGAGKQYYRLKQTDNDGAFSYSGVRILHFESIKGISVYPNPTKDNVTVLGLSGSERVKIYDITGRLLQEHKLKGGDELVVSLEAYVSGVYSLVIADAQGKTETIRVIKN